MNLTCLIANIKRKTGIGTIPLFIQNKHFNLIHYLICNIFKTTMILLWDCKPYTKACVLILFHVRALSIFNLAELLTCKWLWYPLMPCISLQSCKSNISYILTALIQTQYKITRRTGGIEHHRMDYFSWSHNPSCMHPSLDLSLQSSYLL